MNFMSCHQCASNVHGMQTIAVSLLLTEDITLTVNFTKRWNYQRSQKALSVSVKCHVSPTTPRWKTGLVNVKIRTGFWDAHVYEFMANRNWIYTFFQCKSLKQAKGVLIWMGVSENYGLAAQLLPWCRISLLHGCSKTLPAPYLKRHRKSLRLKLSDSRFVN